MHTCEINAAESKFANYMATMAPKLAEPPTTYFTEDYSDTIMDIALAAIMLLHMSIILFEGKC